MLSMLLLDNEEVTLFSFMVAGRHIGGFSEVCVFDVVLHSVISCNSSVVLLLLGTLALFSVLGIHEQSLE